jgi:hypothetical protein
MKEERVLLVGVVGNGESVGKTAYDESLTLEPLRGVLDSLQSATLSLWKIFKHDGLVCKNLR